MLSPESVTYSVTVTVSTGKSVRMKPTTNVLSICDVNTDLAGLHLPIIVGFRRVGGGVGGGVGRESKRERDRDRE